MSEPLPTKPIPGEHYWLSPEQVAERWPSLQAHGFVSCLWCGVVKRRDGKDKPCKGIIKVTLR